MTIFNFKVIMFWNSIENLCSTLAGRSLSDSRAAGIFPNTKPFVTSVFFGFASEIQALAPPLGLGTVVLLLELHGTVDGGVLYKNGRGVINVNGRHGAKEKSVQDLHGGLK